MNIDSKLDNGMKYFDKKVTEEDCPIEIDSEIQDCYAHLEKIFDNIFAENFLENVHVILYFTQARFNR